MKKEETKVDRCDECSMFRELEFIEEEKLWICDCCR